MSALSEGVAIHTAVAALTPTRGSILHTRLLSTVAHPKWRLIDGMLLWIERIAPTNEWEAEPWRERVEVADQFRVGNHSRIIGPDLSDAATRGCVLQLIRTVTKDPHVCVEVTKGIWTVVGAWKRNEQRGEQTQVEYSREDSEGEALRVALCVAYRAGEHAK